MTRLRRKGLGGSREEEEKETGNEGGCHRRRSGEGREEGKGIEKVKERKEEKRMQELEYRKEAEEGNMGGRTTEERRERRKRTGHEIEERKKIVKGIAEVEGK